MVFAPTDRKQFVWPVTGIVFGALIAVNPFYAPDLTLPVGIVAWCVDLVLQIVEFDFRWNTRRLNDGDRTKLAVQGTQGKRLPYLTITR